MRTPTLHIRLLGGFGLHVDDEPVLAVKTARLQSLLAYLVLQRAAQLSRRHVAYTFWPDKTEKQAQNNLRQLLFQLRQALPDSDQYLLADASTLTWQQNARFRLDVLDFETALEAADRAEQAGDLRVLKISLQQALSFYQGELLPNCYDEWIASERHRLHQGYQAALDRLAQVLEDERSYAGAIKHLRKLLHLDPLDENHYRRLMRLYALNEERASALHLYYQCVETLQREIGAGPGPATQEIYHRLLRRQELPGSPADWPEMAAIPPLVGREEEWRTLIRTWQRATSRGARVVLLVGEAGIGKTRLAEELLAWVARQGFSTARTRCYAAEGRLAYGPIADWLRCEAVRPGLRKLDHLWLGEVARLVPELLAETPGLPRPEPLKENWQRQGFYRAIAHALYSVAPPFLLLIDDLQWCDPDTLEWLNYFLRAEPSARLLVVGTIRLEEVQANQALHDWLVALGSTDRMSELHLGALDAAETAQLAARISGRELETHLALHLYTETEGNPLFVLETLRSGQLPTGAEVVHGAGQKLELVGPVPNEPGLPPRVYAILRARLEALSTSARELACLAATIGRAFSFEVLEQASEVDEEALLQGLDELWQRRIVRALDEQTYDFTHDKLREVAYREAGLARRRVLHRRVARALEAMYAADLDPVSGQVAGHFELAGLAEKAIPYYHQAALVAQRIHANHEAISLLERALALLAAQPAGRERDSRELELLTALGVSLVDTAGHGTPPVGRAYNRALALCRQLGQPPTPPVLRALAIDAVVRADFKAALAHSEDLLRLAEQAGQRMLTVEAHYAMGVTKFWLGDFPASRGHLESAIALYNPQEARQHIALYSQNPRLICLSRLAFSLWCLGLPGQALEASQQALKEAQTLAHPFSLAYTLLWNALLQLHLRAFAVASEQLQALVGLCREHQMQHILLEAEVLRGWVRAEQGHAQEGLAAMQDGMERFQSAGAKFQRPLFLSVVGELLGRQGQTQSGLSLLHEAHALTAASEERWCEAELWRRQGELRWLQSKAPAAEADFEQAMRIARAQAAGLLELRAALALGRLWLSQGRGRDAKGLILPLLERSAECADTADGHDARRLLHDCEESAGEAGQ